MWVRTRTGPSCLRVLGAVLATLLAQPLCAQESVLEGQSAQRHLREGQALYARLDYAGAKSSFESAVQLIEQESGPASSELIEPLAALSDVLIATQEPAAAADCLRRAIALIKRRDGLYAERQYVLLRTLVDIDSAAGRLDAAGSSLKQMLGVTQRVHRDDHRSHAGALIEIGSWQCRIGEFAAARGTYRQALAALGPSQDETLLVESLTGLASCCLEELSAEGIETSPGSLERFRGRVLRTERMNPQNPAFRTHVNRILRWQGEQALRRAAAIASSGRLDPERSLRVLLQAGDWFQAKDHHRSARAYYARAEELAARTSGASPFDAPVQVLYPIPAFALRGRGVPQSADAARSIEVEFQVQADGSVQRERVIDRDLGKSFVDEVLSAVRVSRHRPRFESGRAVATDGVRLRQAIPEIR